MIKKSKNNDLLNGHYRNTISKDALILKINDNHFETSGLYNQSDTRVSLISFSGDTISSYQYSADLPEGHSNEKIYLTDNNQKSNWGMSLMKGGTPGWINSLTPVNYDLSIEDNKITFTPPFPMITDVLDFGITVKNRGKSVAENINVSFYLFGIKDSVLLSNHLINSFGINSETIISDTKIINEQDRLSYIVAKIEYSNDEKQYNNLSSKQIIIKNTSISLIINEIMHTPGTGQAEWIELFNTTDSTINLKNWHLSDNSKTILISGLNYQLGPKDYLVLTKKTSFYNIFPEINQSLVLVLNELPLLDNQDSLVIYDQLFDVIDHVSYQSSWGNQTGTSIERIYPRDIRNDESNWDLCIDPKGGTPGKLNSITPANQMNDIELLKLFITNDSLQLRDTLEIELKLFNRGLKPIDYFAINIYDEMNRNGTYDEMIDDLLEKRIFQNINFQVNDTIYIQFELADLSPGVHHLTVLAELKNDGNSRNNQLSAQIVIGGFPQILIFNEIMYSPSPNSSEYIEVYNHFDRSVNLESWKISRRESEFLIIEEPYYLAGNDYVVIADDTSICNTFVNINCEEVIFPKKWQTLKNDGDSIIIIDPLGNVTDSLRYFSDWGGAKGISMERINPLINSNDEFNWGSSRSIYGGTPTTKNSIFTDILPSRSSLFVSPNPFSPDGDGFEDFAIITFEMPITEVLLNIRIFDIHGRLIRFLVNNMSVSSSDHFIWDGKNDQGDKVRIGVYIIFLEAINDRTGYIGKIKKTVVVAGKL